MKRQGQKPIGKLGQTGLAVLFEADVKKFISKWKGDFRVTEFDAMALAMAAIWPHMMVDPKHAGLPPRINRLYAAHPSFVLAFLTYMRELWDNQTAVFKVKKFILENHGRIDENNHMMSDETERSKEKAIQAALKKQRIHVSLDTIKTARQEILRAQIKA